MIGTDGESCTRSDAAVLPLQCSLTRRVSAHAQSLSEPPMTLRSVILLLEIRKLGGKNHRLVMKEGAHPDPGCLFPNSSVLPASRQERADWTVC